MPGKKSSEKTSNGSVALLANPAALNSKPFLHEHQFFDRLDSVYLFRPKVKILIVTDGSGAFDDSSSFGLGTVINEMKNDPWWWVKFEITTAHRRNNFSASSADHQNFRFDSPPVALSNFDQIWLFGVEGRGSSGQAATPANNISAAEVTEIRKFMDNGGGIFATGDHFALGECLCADIPRVRKMRRWEPGGPVGTPPNPTGSGRYDTCRIGSTPGYQFDDQEDNTPQPIYPTHYYDPWSYSPFQQKWRPHPVLCGRAGIVDVLPDHMHENRIPMPNQGAVNSAPDEWPGGLAHDVIAKARVIPHTNTDGFGYASGPAAEEGLAEGEFGVLGAYDGHKQDVGRIVTDATWHHWFNINLRGFDTSSAHYDEIRNYFWNVGLWLSPKTKQSQLFHAAVYGLVWLGPILELGPKVDLVYLGFTGIDAIGRRVSRCVATEWILGQFPLELQRELEPIPKIPNPPDPPPFLTLNYVREYVLGGIIQQVMLAYGPNAEKEDRKPDYKELLSLSKRGVNIGLETLLKEQKRELSLREKEFKQLENLVGMVSKR